MAAYAALVSLMNTTDQIMNHPRLSTCLDKQQIQFLGQNLGILLEFIENYNSHGGDKEVAGLESKIAHAAHTAEDVIESHIVDQIHAGVFEQAPSFSIDLHQIIQGIDQIKEEIGQVEEKSGIKNKKRKYSSAAAASSEPLPTGKTTMVGFDEYLDQLLDDLTGLEPRRQVIPIVGMGGIGKTTLARYTYESLLIAHYFDIRAWVSISQDYSVKKIFVQLLSSLGQLMDGTLEENVNEDQLSERLYKFLCGRRYLIILDDMWSVTAWDRIRFFFPDDCNSSRIVVTTRLLEVANYFGSSRVVAMDLLDDDKSWDLFCHKAFTQEGSGCPAELEQIGKTIVKKCKGLPLSIVVIGALLGKSSPTKEYWENIVEDMNSILNSAEDNQFHNVLSLSYNHLPARLKPCFLYLGIFPEDHKIRVSQLIKLWVAEGFIKQDKDQRLEEVAEGYMNDLLGRNLIIVGGLGWNRKCETFYIHDLLRDLCLRVAEKENFFCVTRALETPQGIDRERRIAIHQGTPARGVSFDGLKSTSTARSLIGQWGEPVFECRLLRVLSADYDDDRNHFPGVSFEQVNMRLFDYKCVVPMVTLKGTHELPRSISQLWNLQTLILVFDGILEAPPEIWKLRQLRHLESGVMTLPDPPLSDEQEQDDELVLHNLETLMGVKDFRCSEEVCKRIPNIKRLHVSYHKMWEELMYKETTKSCFENVGCLNKLESLSYEISGVPARVHFLQSIKFPTSLRELSLWNCWLDWDDLRMIGWLPYLQLLKLLHNSFTGEEWSPVEGGFLALKYLKIGCHELKIWNADKSHFPVLDTLVLHDLFILDGIPLGIGDIPTLTCIRVKNCSISGAVSAMRILEEQESMGNDALQIQVKYREKTDVENFKEQVEMEGITCANFKIINK
ncbi:hypothetical protein C2S51_003421 [Perilla frutescens var. frutescens]|nr:hypothetical protein C2S51_003421 [Perilla frutescens var. frutescens]